MLHADLSPTLLRELTELAASLARAAGDEALAGRRSIPTGNHVDHDTKSSATDPVTEFDRAAERRIVDGLIAARPDDAIVGEEGANRPGTTGIEWHVDPIDGTVNYLYGRPEYAVSVAVVVGDPTTAGAWRPVVGAVANPETGQVYHAYDGGGAYLRDEAGERRLTVTSVQDAAMVLLATGFGYEVEVRREQSRALVEILPAVRDIRRGGSAALDLCTVASGVVDAYAERGVHLWDIAAGWVIAGEAGARVLTWSGGPDRPLGILAAPEAVADALLELVARAFTGARRDPLG
ncbi:MAG: inositol monophosphatase [Austwickia sp.]|nr:inositol monophosphatase [Austwickia sp.]